MNKDEILIILESFNNKYGAVANDRRKAVETVLAKKGVKDNLHSTTIQVLLFDEWINEGTPGSVPEWLVEALYHLPPAYGCYHPYFVEIWKTIVKHKTD